MYLVSKATSNRDYQKGTYMPAKSGSARRVHRVRILGHRPTNPFCLYALPLGGPCPFPTLLCLFLPKGSSFLWLPKRDLKQSNMVNSPAVLSIDISSFAVSDHLSTFAQQRDALVASPKIAYSLGADPRFHLMKMVIFKLGAG